jgi:tight adherence protein B
MMDASSRLWIVAALGATAVALLAFAATLLLEGARERQRRRAVVAQLHGLDGRWGAELDAAGGILQGSEAAMARWLEPLAGRFSHLWNIHLQLRRAGLRWSVQHFLLLVGGFAGGLGLAGWLATSSGTVALLAAALGAWLPYLHVGRKKSKRIAAFEEQFPEAVELVARSLRAGHPFSASLKLASEECEQPVRGEFRQVFEEQRLGLPLDDALLGLAERVDLVDTRIFVTAVMIQREVGGNLAEVLDNLSHLIRERFKMRGQLRTLTAEGRMSMYVLLALPPILAAIMYVLNPEYIMTLFETPIGNTLLVGSLVMQFLGYLWMRSIIKIKM